MPQRSGFTLIELLMALFISAFVMIALYSTIYSGFKARDSAMNALQPVQAANVAMDLIRNDLEAAQPAGQLLSGAFTGTQNYDGNGNDSVTFYATSDAPHHDYGQGEVKQVQLLVTQLPGSSDNVLVRWVTSNLLADVQPNPDQDVICRHVLHFNLHYFDGTDWYDSWDSTQQGNVVPYAVEVTLDILPPGAVKGTPPIHMDRIIPLSCATQASTSGSSGSTGSTGSTGATGSTGSTGSRSTPTGGR